MRTLPRPLRNQILIRQDPPKEKVGSLFVPQGSEEYPPLGIVLAVGPGLYGPGGVRIPLDVKVGDRIMFKRMPDTALVPDSRDGDPNGWINHLMILEDHVVGVITEEG